MTRRCACGTCDRARSMPSRPSSPSQIPSPLSPSLPSLSSFKVLLCSWRPLLLIDQRGLQIFGEADDGPILINPQVQHVMSARSFLLGRAAPDLMSDLFSRPHSFCASDCQNGTWTCKACGISSEKPVWPRKDYVMPFSHTLVRMPQCRDPGCERGWHSAAL